MVRSLSARIPQGRSHVTNGRSLFLDRDPKSRASRRFRDLLAAIAADLGGPDHLSTGQMQLARRCALLSVQCEEFEQKAVSGQQFDLDLYGRMTDRLGRALQRLGLRREAKDVTPTLQGYLAESYPPPRSPTDETSR